MLLYVHLLLLLLKLHATSFKCTVWEYQNSGFASSRKCATPLLEPYYVLHYKWLKMTQKAAKSTCAYCMCNFCCRCLRLKPKKKNRKSRQDVPSECLCGEPLPAVAAAVAIVLLLFIPFAKPEFLVTLPKRKTGWLWLPIGPSDQVPSPTSWKMIHGTWEIWETFQEYLKLIKRKNHLKISKDI